MSDEISYTFSNYNCVAIEVWEWISKFISHFTGCVITYPCMLHGYITDTMTIKQFYSAAQCFSNQATENEAMSKNYFTRYEFKGYPVLKEPPDSEYHNELG